MFKKLLTILFIAVTLTSTFSKNAFAVEDSLSVPNNFYGIHILDENDLGDAANLVNSSGGDWGYVTLVIRKDERDTKRWQNVFNKMRRLHLIPIVRIATRQLGETWEKPSFDEIDGWVSFLSQLNWVVKNRYVVLGNEPNHAKEWGADINPEEYASYLYEFSKRLKNSSLEFFILPAGFDASAIKGKDSIGEEEFLRRMTQDNPKVFDYVDGWASHSYPNPGFSGSEDASGRGSVRTFDWELMTLKKLGIEKELPVFITETGWVHGVEKEGETQTNFSSVSEKITKAFNTAWQDPKIVAITPFVLNYQGVPFDTFSWKNKEGVFYDFYYAVQKLPKLRGTPTQNVIADVISIIFPPILPKDKKFIGLAYVKNRGQTIWEGGESISSKKDNFLISVEPVIFFSNVEPGRGSLAILKVSF